MDWKTNRMAGHSQIQNQNPQFFHRLRNQQIDLFPRELQRSFRAPLFRPT